MLAHGLVADFGDKPAPCRIYGVVNRRSIKLMGEPGTAYGFCFKGLLQVAERETMRVVRQGQFFSAPTQGEMMISAGAKVEAFTVFRPGVIGLGIVGGPLENEGRQLFVGGMKTTVLIPPPAFGDPCLYQLSVPGNGELIVHKFPTARAAFVTDGYGQCHWPPAECIDLVPGAIIILPPDCPHAFAAHQGGMNMVVFQPDSKYGPDDVDNPASNSALPADFALPGAAAA